jgi:hypothetical protein
MTGQVSSRVGELVREVLPRQTSQQSNASCWLARGLNTTLGYAYVHREEFCVFIFNRAPEISQLLAVQVTELLLIGHNLLYRAWTDRDLVYVLYIYELYISCNNM